MRMGHGRISSIFTVRPISDVNRDKRHFDFACGEKVHVCRYRRTAKMRSFVLSGISFALTGGVIANAYYQKKQFYPSVVYITKSNPSMAVSSHICR